MPFDPEIAAVLSGESEGCIVCADCLDILPTLPDGCVDAVIADPPYGIGVAEWDIFSSQWLTVARRLGPAAVFSGVRAISDYPRADWIGAWVRVGSTQRCGKFKGFNNWEPILFYGIDSLANDVIATPNYAQPDIEHPSPKPLRLMELLVLRMPGDIILDPFCGSGTTCVAAKKLGRRYIGIEISEKYCAIARLRLAGTPRPLFAPEPQRCETPSLYAEKEN